MPSGGRRLGAGRPPGAGEARRRRRALVEAAIPAGSTPLEMMLEAAREAYKEGGAKAAFGYAKECAPYIHPRLASVVSKVEATVRNVISSEPLSEEEWVATYGDGGHPGSLN